MKVKLQIAIASIVIQFIIYNYISLFTYEANNNFLLFEIITSISSLCSLGTIPFFISLYKSKDFNNLINKDNSEKSNEKWVNHLLIRGGIIGAACLLVFFLSSLEGGMGGGYILIYGLSFVYVISFIILAIESLYLINKKHWDKFYCNIVIVGLLLYIALKVYSFS